MRALVAALFCALAAPSAAQVQGIMLDAAVDLPEFEFTNELGERFTGDDLTGAWTIVMFGFLSCPDVCPFTLGNLEAAVSETGMRVRPDNVPKVVFHLGRSCAGCRIHQRIREVLSPGFHQFHRGA